MIPASAAALAATVLATVAAGCGPGPGAAATDATVTVTRNFGTASVAAIATHRIPGSETIAGLLEGHLRIGTRYSGDFVESIDGFSGTAAHRDWFYYVDGIEAPMGAGTTPVRAGDRIWWDLHDWSATDSIPAVVGSYPDPFTQDAATRHGTAVLCVPIPSSACTDVVQALSRAGVATRPQVAIRPPADHSAPTVLVGTLPALADTPAARLIAAGPQASGVYVRVTDAGQRLELLDPHAHTVEKLGRGAGLVAATVLPGAPTATWLVTGTDATGLAAAARALTPSLLHDRFALVLAGRRAIGVPVDPAS